MVDPATATHCPCASHESITWCPIHDASETGSVFTRAAYDLQVQATAHSARCGHPVRTDDYLEHLDGLGIETTIPAAELCAIGTWERRRRGLPRSGLGAVEVCLDSYVRTKARTLQALAWTGTRGQDPGPAWPRRMVVSPPCAACGAPAAHIELLAPGQLPAGWDQRPSTPGSFLQPPGQDSGTPAPGHRHRHQLRRPHRRQPLPGASPGRSGLPCASPGPHRQAPRRRRILP